MELVGPLDVSVFESKRMEATSPLGASKPKHCQFHKKTTGESHVKEFGAVLDREGFREERKGGSADMRAISPTVPMENWPGKRTLRPTETIRPNETKRR